VQLQSVPGEPPEASDPRQFLLEQLGRRGIVLISGLLDDSTVARVTAQALTTADDRLTVHLANVSGPVRVALALHDVLASLEQRPSIVASGGLDTAGAIVLQSAAPGERTLTPTARIHLTKVREPEGFDQPIDVEAAAQEIEIVRRQVADALGRAPAGEILGAEEAVARGLADRISLQMK